MSRTVSKWVKLLLLSAVLGSSVTSLALAERKYDAGDVEGVYHYVATFTRAPGVEHCQSFGTLTFDGMDEVWVDSNDACEGGLFKTESHLHIYAVDVSGKVIIDESAGGSTDCQLVNKGDTLLCHGANRTDLLNLMAVGARVD